MPGRHIPDPTFQLVAHRLACKRDMCPICTKAPASKREATKQEMGKLAHAANQRYRARLEAATITSPTNGEDPALERRVSVTKSLNEESRNE